LVSGIRPGCHRNVAISRLSTCRAPWTAANRFRIAELEGQKGTSTSSRCCQWKVQKSHCTKLTRAQVTYDEHSLLVHGQRIFIFSGEFHPFRLPVPDLWLDILQKIKAMGYNTVSFYIDVTITFLCLHSFRFLDFAAMCFASSVSSSSVLDLRIKTHTNLL
jgi:hypothetical protein